MPKKLYIINLNEEARQALLEMTCKGKIKARQMKRAMILLKANEGLSDPQIMSALNVSRPCYETFPPEEARRILKKLEFHFTSKHGSWLNMAEIELSMFSRRLKQNIPNETILDKEVHAITDERNGVHAIINWQFRTEDARIKLKQLYPSISA